jgi:hypothetical protein
LPTTRQLARPVNTSAFVGTKPTGDLVTSGLLVICPQSLPALILFTASCRQEAGLAFNPSVEGQRQAVFISSNDTDASATVAAVATQLGFAPVELGRLDKGGVPLHVLGGRLGGLLFQNLEKLG